MLVPGLGGLIYGEVFASPEFNKPTLTRDLIKNIQDKIKKSKPLSIDSVLEFGVPFDCESLFLMKLFGCTSWNSVAHLTAWLHFKDMISTGWLKAASIVQGSDDKPVYHLVVDIKARSLREVRSEIYRRELVKTQRLPAKPFILYLAWILSKDKENYPALPEGIFSNFSIF